MKRTIKPQKKLGKNISQIVVENMIVQSMRQRIGMETIDAKSLGNVKEQLCVNYN